MCVYDPHVEVIEQLEGASLSSHHVGPGDEIQAISRRMQLL